MKKKGLIVKQPMFSIRLIQTRSHLDAPTLPAGSIRLPSSRIRSLNWEVFTIQYGQYTTIDLCPPLPNVFSTWIRNFWPAESNRKTESSPECDQIKALLVNIVIYIRSFNDIIALIRVKSIIVQIKKLGSYLPHFLLKNLQEFFEFFQQTIDRILWQRVYGSRFLPVSHEEINRDEKGND